MTQTLSASLKTAWAPAKVNLYIHVGTPGAGGLHPVDSLVMFADTRAADRVSARAHPQLSLSIEGPRAKSLKNAPHNLVMAAASALREASGQTARGAALTLHKVLPVAGGVGGGSADAAAALHVLNEMWSLGFGVAALERLGAQLGSDVPACVRGRPLLMRGTGERLETTAAPDLHAVLVNPGVMLETPRVFARFDAMQTKAKFVETPAPTGDTDIDFIKALKGFRNDLEAASISLCPDVGKVLEALRAQKGTLLARMSGSGPTCFGLYGSAATAEAAATALSKLTIGRRKLWVQQTILRGGDAPALGSPG
ncbi:4-(cytidine 5'-diphospho)-2-C-methyl-D-erythritol kinase [bacterium]|nr:4-(cytidine 5'-diphospho)-2-C-methyl-D-erythritol kinase [bacterium]